MYVNYGGVVANMGATKTQWRAYNGKRELVKSWEAPTSSFTSPFDLLRDGFAVATAALGGSPNFGGFCFSGPVDPETGDVCLTNVPQFGRQRIDRATSRRLLGAPTHHVNNVAASAALLANLGRFKLEHLNTLRLKDTNRLALVDISAGLGTAFFMRSPEMPNGFVVPSELQHAYSHEPVESAGRRYSFESTVGGGRGFEIHTDMIRRFDNVEIPAAVEYALQSPIKPAHMVTEFIRTSPNHPFSQRFVARYGACLGAYLRELHLAFQPQAILLGGSVGRTPRFLELVLGQDDFISAFRGTQDIVNIQIEERTRLPLARIADHEMAIVGTYEAALRHFGLVD